jgi:hypothetical protein
MAGFMSKMNKARFVVMTGTRLYIQWTYTREPIYWLPKGWIPWYGEWILSFPRAPAGSVSVQVWQLACGAVLGMLAEAVSALVALVLGPGKSKAENRSQEDVPTGKAHQQ